MSALKTSGRAHCSAGGAAALVDRRSVRRTQQRTLHPLQLQRAVVLRHELCTLRRAARDLAAPLCTVGQVLKALGLRRFKNLQLPEPARHYQRARPCDMIHVDTKQISRFNGLVTGSPKIAVWAALVVPFTRKLIWPLTTPHD